MKTSSRLRVLGLVLVGVLIAAWFAPPIEDESVILSDRSRARGQQKGDEKSGAPDRQVVPHVRTTRDALSATESGLTVLQLRARGSTSDVEEQESPLFAAAGWDAPPKSPKVVATPVVTEVPAPKAPPVPFRFLGRYEDGGDTVLFLQHLDQNLVVRMGDIVLDRYKVESLQGTTLVLRYLPLNEPQTLDVANSH